MSELYDVTIIGGGTTGLYTAFYSGMRDMKTKVIEYQPDLGGKVSFFYPEKKIYDVGGFLGILGDDLVADVKEQALSVRPTFVMGQKIRAIDKQEDGTFMLTSLTGEKHFSKTVVVASGLGTYDMRPLDVEGSHLYEGKHIHYTIQNLMQYTGQKAVVISESRVGVDWALALEDVASAVHLINRGSEFKAVYENDVEKLKQSSVQVHMEAKVEQLKGTEVELEGVVLNNGEHIQTDHLLVYEGLQIDKSLYDQWGLTTEKGRIPVGTDMATSIEGVFVAGDAAIYPSKMMLIASGFNEAMAAVNSAKSFIDPKAKSQVYSTVIYKHLE
ncbi:NAD(P)/FAD-dependent oxidoreductase [Halobacillus shinanisalinarum]|uniref:Ferredoxin--NADP reductase n=1 Tax=Halobacillus shinanisalinarum TaxID=2932258 RepID=A0ABY4GXZ1_9BACI|nr:NAD(P)/FAD-dependent oxidoreductase [Halobacillus shinanisalinarum]UOQ91642.1 NAD(P)/FAD-dependent oxidoreductase [Halobacillus shinanisalinarum]